MAEIVLSSVLTLCFVVFTALAVVMAVHSIKDDKRSEEHRKAQEIRDKAYYESLTKK